MHVILRLRLLTPCRLIASCCIVVYVSQLKKRAGVVGGLTALRAATKVGWGHGQDVFCGLQHAHGLSTVVWLMKRYDIGQRLLRGNATSLLLCRNLTSVQLGIDVDGDVAPHLLELPLLEDLDVRSISALPRDVDRNTAKALEHVCLQYQLFRQPDMAILFRMAKASRSIWINRTSDDDEYAEDEEYVEMPHDATLRIVTERDMASCKELMKALRFDYNGDTLSVEHAAEWGRGQAP